MIGIQRFLKLNRGLLGIFHFLRLLQSPNILAVANIRNECALSNVKDIARKYSLGAP
jgi:hypothetical protein